MKSFLVLIVLTVLGLGNGRHTPRPDQSGSVQYSTKRNQSIEIHIMFHVDPALAVKLAKQYRFKNRNKLKQIAPKILNDVGIYFQQRSLNQTIRFKLIDTKFIKKNNNVLKIDENASKYLKSYCNWQSRKKMSMKRIYYSVLLTGLDLYYVNGRGEEVRGSAGRSYMSSMCSLTKSCTLIEWHPKNIGFFLAHEIAHGLGMSHDEAPFNNCRGNYVMRSKYNDRNHTRTWSECSQHDLKRYLQSSKSWCIKAERNQ